MKLLDFWATWCAPCKKMAGTLEEIKSLYPDIEIVKHNVERDTDLTNKYGIKSIPTLVLLGEKDKELSRISGALGKDDLRKWLDNYAKR